MGAVAPVQSALVGDSVENIILTQSAPRPPALLEDDQIAVEVKAVSLNPIDTKMTGKFHTPGAILGCEFAGIVTAVGRLAASQWGFQPGDRISAAITGMNPSRPTIGAFAQYTVAPAPVALRIPYDWTFEQAAGLGIAWYTNAWALFYTMGLPAGPQLEPLNSEMAPPSGLEPAIGVDNFGGKPAIVLVSGGSSSTGTCAIQLLKLAGFHVITTCSKRNFELTKSFGADAVFDHSSSTCAAEIKAYTRSNLRFALDCITTPDTTRLCYASIGRRGGRYVSLDPYSEVVAATRSAVRPAWVLGPELIGEELVWPKPHGRKGNPTARAFCEVWNRTMQTLLQRDLIRTHPQVVRSSGLAGVLGGLEEIRAKRVSGQKLIYTL